MSSNGENSTNKLIFWLLGIFGAIVVSIATARISYVDGKVKEFELAQGALRDRVVRIESEMEHAHADMRDAAKRINERLDIFLREQAVNRSNIERGRKE